MSGIGKNPASPADITTDIDLTSDKPSALAQPTTRTLTPRERLIRSVNDGLMTFLVVLILLAIRTPKEERMLIERFGTLIAGGVDLFAYRFGFVLLFAGSTWILSEAFIRERKRCRSGFVGPAGIRSKLARIWLRCRRGNGEKCLFNSA